METSISSQLGAMVHWLGNLVPGTLHENDNLYPELSFLLQSPNTTINFGNHICQLQHPTGLFTSLSPLYSSMFVKCKLLVFSKIFVQ